MNNPLSTLLGKSFPLSANIGNTLEMLLGGIKNPNPGADFLNWELKSRRIDAHSPYITLGGKRGGSDVELIEQVYSKVVNVIFIEYSLSDVEFKVEKITILWELDKSDFINAFGKQLKVESRSTGERNIKVSPKAFMSLYGKKVIQYSA